MEFLQNLFGENAITYDQLVEAIKVHNETETDVTKQIKIFNLSSGDYVSKAKYEAKEEELSQANTIIGQRDKQIKELGKVEDIEALQTQIATLAADNKVAAEQYARDLKIKDIEHTIDSVLTKEKAKNVKVALAALELDIKDLEKLELSEIEKQVREKVTEVKKTEGYLFEIETDPKNPAGYVPSNPKNPNPGGKDDSQKSYADWAKELND